METAQNVVTRRYVVTNAKNGSTLNATDLINPKSTITGETPNHEKSHETLVLPLIVRKIS
jgi:hypothetical protein